MAAQLSLNPGAPEAPDAFGPPGSPAAIDARIDALTRLCREGHRATARALAEATLAEDALAGQLALAAVAAATHDRELLDSAVSRAMALAPGHPAVLRAQAVSRALAGDRDASIAAARAAAAADPSPRSRGGLARLLLSWGERDEAVALLEQLARDDDPDAHLQLATVARGDAALDHLVRAFFAAPREPAAMQALMNEFREVGWAIGTAVVAAHVRSTAASPGLRFVSDLIALATRLYLRGTPLEGLVQTPPTFFANARLAAAGAPVAAQLVLVGLFLDHGRTDDARAHNASLAARLATPQERAHHAFLEGRLAQAIGRSDLAIGHYEQALAHDPRYADAACNLMSALFAQASPAALERIGAVVASMPEWHRRSSPMLTYNEAGWLELRGARAEALALVDFLMEAPLGVLEPAVHAMRARLARADAS